MNRTRTSKRLAASALTSAKPSKVSKVTHRESDSDTVAVKHDTSYYFEDGDIIMRVEDTLLKVHRLVLARDGSAFGDMLALPSGDQRVEGGSDENPVILQGDTLKEFHNLAWALYALPTEIRSNPTSDEEFLRMVDVAKMSHKYGFPSYETWAVDALAEYAKTHTGTLPNGSKSYEALIIIAMNSSIKMLVQRLVADRKTHVDRLFASKRGGILEILLMAHRLGFRRLEGYCYYNIMLLGWAYWRAEPGLTVEHEAALLRGFDAATQRSEELVENISPLIDMCCDECISGWEEVCEDFDDVTDIPTKDILGRMKDMRASIFEVSPLGSDLHGMRFYFCSEGETTDEDGTAKARKRETERSNCHKAQCRNALKMLDDMIWKTEKHLLDFFIQRPPSHLVQTM